MLEYEKKVMLTYDEYSVLIKKLGHSVSTVIQTNYYFDNDDLSMNKNGITCRVRAKGGKYKATIKKHNMDSPDCSYETELTESKTFDPDAFKEFGLRCRGRLVTFRNEVYKDSTCEMVLDKNVYLGYTDYELEIEYRKDCDKKAQELIESVAKYLIDVNLLSDPADLLNRIGQGRPKSQRLFERLKKLK